MIYRFDNFELDMDRFELRTGDAILPLEPQVFALLAFLVERRERLVSRDETLRETLGWTDRYRLDADQPGQVSPSGTG